MQVLIWGHLDPQAQQKALQRPQMGGQALIDERVVDLIRRVRSGGDNALRQLIRELDGSPADALFVTEDEFDQAEAQLPVEVSMAIDTALDRITAWHQRSTPASRSEEVVPGCTLGIEYRPIQRVGLYVPAGSAPLPSTALMLGVPAQVAGCPNVTLATPADEKGQVDPATLVAARRCGITRVLKAGGAHAIAALAYGTESIAKVDKVFGPGNAWVTRAKQRVALDADGAACDLPAGPSEVMVVADGSATPAWVAADLLSQAEHGPDSQVIAVLLDSDLAADVQAALTEQLASLPRAAIAQRSLQSARLIVVDHQEAAVKVINQYAPEHLILQVEGAREWLPGINASGSIFLGAYAPESAGDYASGTNHVLPTGGFARAWSGLTVSSFMTSISVQELTRDALVELAPAITTLARWEGLEAHARTVDLRISAMPTAGDS